MKSRYPWLINESARCSISIVTQENKDINDLPTFFYINNGLVSINSLQKSKWSMGHFDLEFNAHMGKDTYKLQGFFYPISTDKESIFFPKEIPNRYRDSTMYHFQYGNFELHTMWKMIQLPEELWETE